MTYCTREALKAYLGMGTAYDDDLLDDLIADAQRIIDVRTGRSFEASSATRYFTQDDIDGVVLWLDRDLLTVTTLTNGDGTAITSGYYRLLPLNDSPKYAIQLVNGKSWAWTSLESLVTVVGTWGYSTMAPDVVATAAKYLAGWLYRRKDAGPVDLTAIAQMGQIVVQDSGLRGVFDMVDPLRRLV